MIRALFGIKDLPPDLQQQLDKEERRTVTWNARKDRAVTIAAIGMSFGFMLATLVAITLGLIALARVVL